MKVELYNYTKKNNVANKIKGLSPTYSGDISPYGEFSSENVVFKLDVMYDVNFCRFEYNNHYYYGSVRINVDTNGLYVYNVTTDALTTAWYNGCCNTSNICKYCSSGSDLIYDDRIATYDYVDRTEFSITNSVTQEYYVIMTVKRNRPRINTYSIANPAFDVYVFERLAFMEFGIALQSLDPADQAKYIPSIMSLYVVQADEIDANAFQGAQLNAVFLYPILGSTDSETSINDVLNVNVTGHGYYCHELVYSNTNNSSRAVRQSKNISFPINSTRQNSIFNLHVRDAGDFTFKYSDVVKNANITSVGYEISFDFISGRKSTFLVINNNILKDYRIDSNIPLAFPISYDSSIDRWDRLNSSIAGSLINTISSVVSPTPNAIFNVASNLINANQTYLDFKFNQNYGARNTVGGVGGTTETMANIGSYLIVKSRAQIGVGNFQNLFGKPDFASRVLQNVATGYVETLNCKLLEMGIASDIIREAEKQCDAGFYII